MAAYCKYCNALGNLHKTAICPGIEEPKIYDLNKLQDAAVDFAKDLLMHDFAPLMDDLTERRHETEKRAAFYRFVVALHAARGLAEEFRKAHVAEKRQDLRSEMDAQFQTRLREIEAMTPAGEPRGVS